MKVGERAGAICGEKDGVLCVFGFGVFAGDSVPSPDVTFMGMPYAEVMEAKPNPQITLDSGEIVYGCECWWGPEDKVQASITAAEAAGKKIESITVAEYRAQGNRVNDGS